MLHFYVILSVFLSKGHGIGPAVEFDIPKNSANVYMGELFKHEPIVKLTPRLRASIVQGRSKTNQICGFHAIYKDEPEFPFEVKLKDWNLGEGEISLRDNVPVDFDQNKMYTFQIEAFDCDQPPNFSERVLVQVSLLAKEQLRFTEPVYNFSAVTYSRVGDICGKVTVLHESSNHQNGGREHCGYALLAGEIVPFSIDFHGVIRTRDVLTSESPKVYSFRVQYKDCGALRTEIVTATVNIQLIQNNCQLQWKGLPPSVFYSDTEPRPKRLLWPQSYVLDMCGVTCEGGSPRFLTQVSLRHAQAGRTVNAASPAFCRHDPTSLYDQRKLCEVDQATMIDLLPNPRRGILGQRIAPAVGALPEVVPLSLALRFSSKARTGWHLDTAKLMVAAKSTQDRLMSDGYAKTKISPTNLFERDFTLSFWLQRETTEDDDHESILCSQEDTASIGRALWISLKSCRIMVQMTTRNPHSRDPLISNIFRTYYFPQLPLSVCGSQDRPTWHHYSISVSVDPVTADFRHSVLMVDGELVGTLEQFGEPIFVNRPTKEHFTQFITIGTCYDPSIPGPQQSLNGVLTGMTLLLGRNEDQSVSRCLAECGETLLIPRAGQLITDDVSVLLNSDSILLESATSADTALLLSNVAYVNPVSTGTQLSFDPDASNRRVLEVSTTYRCGKQKVLNVTTARIRLALQDSFTSTGKIEPPELPEMSSWMPKDEMLPVHDPPQRENSPALTLAIFGPEVVYADIPVLEPGITMFPRLEFTFTNAPYHTKALARSASMFILDQCLVLPANGSSLDVNAGERIVWPAGRAFEMGVSVEPTKMGVRLRGRQTANQYASLLHNFRYWPPIEIEKAVNDEGLSSGFLLERKFQLICSYTDAGYQIRPFKLRIILKSPVIAENVASGSRVLYSDNSRGDLDNDYANDSTDDDYDEEEIFGDTAADDDAAAGGGGGGEMTPNNDDPRVSGAEQWPPVSELAARLEPSPQYKPAMEGANFAHVNNELRSDKQIFLRTKEETVADARGKEDYLGLTVGLVVGAIAVATVVAGFLITKFSGRLRSLQRSFFGRPEHTSAHTGCLQFHRPEGSLNVIENPIGRLEGGRLNWQPPVSNETCPVMSAGLPGVHTSNLRNDDQFAAETRSFNGLFDDELEEDVVEGAALEEVDDFDDSEVVQTQPMVRGLAKDLGDDDEEGLSDQEDETSFSMGPNHLEFVTLPSRGFNIDV